VDWGNNRIAGEPTREESILDFEACALMEWIAVFGKCLLDGAINVEESWALVRHRDFSKRKMRQDEHDMVGYLKTMLDELLKCEASGDIARANARHVRT
jgi:hypothetical protein